MSEITDDLIKNLKALREKQKLAEAQAAAISPRWLFEKISEVVVGQTEAKKLLSTAAYRHYRNAGLVLGGKKTRKPFNNIILAGPTGVGKTLLVKTMAEILNVAFLHVDCSGITAAGYVGNSIQDEFKRLKNDRGNDPRFAIVLLDEIDKLAPKDNQSGVTTVQVQYELLRILEGEVCFTVKGPGGEEPVSLDTSNMLFIGAGAFGGQISERSESRGVGFGAKNTNKTINEQLESYGLIPEIIGRFTTGAILKDLTAEDYRQIVYGSSISPLLTLQEVFARDGKNLILSQESFDKIIEEATSKKVGARGLTATLEQLTLDIQFDRLNDGTTGDIVI